MQVYNNTFIRCDTAVHLDDRGLTWQKQYCGVGGIFQSELEKLNYTQPPWSTHYPELVNIMQTKPCVPVYNVGCEPPSLTVVSLTTTTITAITATTFSVVQRARVQTGSCVRARALTRLTVKYPGGHSYGLMQNVVTICKTLSGQQCPCSHGNDYLLPAPPCGTQNVSHNSYCKCGSFADVTPAQAASWSSTLAGNTETSACDASTRKLISSPPFDSFVHVGGRPIV